LSLYSICSVAFCVGSFSLKSDMFFSRKSAKLIQCETQSLGLYNARPWLRIRGLNC
jgi:hypothetical protein